MSTAREAILERMATLLGTVPGATFFRSRQSAVDRSEGQAIILHPEEEVVEKRAGTGRMAIVFRRCTVVVTYLLRGDPPDQIADPIIQAAHAALMSDPTLATLCSSFLEHSTKWLFAEADLTAAAVEARYDVIYQTSAVDLTAIS